MRLSARCTHINFDAGYWVSIDPMGMYVTRNGGCMAPQNFWASCLGLGWETGWEFASGHDACTCIAAREYGCPLEDVTISMWWDVHSRYFGASV